MRRRSSLTRSTDAPAVVQKAVPLVPFEASYECSQAKGCMGLFLASTNLESGASVSVTAGGRSAMLYSASDIEVLDAEGEREHPFLSRLGPDVLSQAPTPVDLAARLRERTRGSPA